MKFAEVQVGVPYPEKIFKVTAEAVKAYLTAVEDDSPLYVDEQLRTFCHLVQDRDFRIPSG